MIEADVGGGFGVRGEFYPEDFLIPFAAHRLAGAVKWIEDRREHLIATNHARDAECELEIACNRDGTIRGLRGSGAVDLGAYIRTNGITAARNIAQVLSGPYRIPDIHFDVALLVTNKTPSGTYRGPGRFEADFFRERLFDMAAAELGIDRVEFRRRNLISEAEMPWHLATVDAAGRQERDRQRRLPGDARSLPQGVRLGRQDGAARPEDRRPLSRHRGRLLFRRRRLRAARERAAGARNRRHGFGLCRLFGDRAGDRDDVRADRRRCAGHADGAHPRRVPRLDVPCLARLRLLQLALDGDGRLGDPCGRGQPEGCDPRRCGKAA